MPGITRREWAAALGASVAAAPAQTPPASTQPTAGDLLDEAKGDLKKTLDGLRQFKLETAAEPAFVFKP